MRLFPVKKSSLFIQSHVIVKLIALSLTLKGARMVRELFEMARGKKACIIFFDEIDAVGGKLRSFFSC